MSNLLKSDMLHFLKSKQFLICAILSVTVAILLPFISFAATNWFNTFVISTSYSEDDIDIAKLIVYAKDFSFTNFGFEFKMLLHSTDNEVLNLSSMVNIPFIISVIMFSILVARDFTYGTIRNKIITGKTKLEIYCSLFITLLVFMFGIAIVANTCSLLMASILFPFAESGWSFVNNIGNLFLSLFFVILVYVFVCSFICALAVGVGKTALAIVFSMLLALAGYMLVSFEPLVSLLLEGFNSDGKFNFVMDIIRLLRIMNPFVTCEACNLDGFKPYEIIGYTVFPIIYIALLNGLGILIFYKRDIK